jgi:hypothetical protein
MLQLLARVGMMENAKPEEGPGALRAEVRVTKLKRQ